MNREQEMNVAAALNYAIYLRDNADEMSKEQLNNSVYEIGKYGVFSNRQISAIANGRISHVAVGKLVNKTNKTGGNLNVGTLDILRNILYNRATSDTDFNLIYDAVGKGTSQNMVEKLTGISQGTISKKIREINDAKKSA